MTSLRDDQSEEVLPLIIGQDSLQVQDKQHTSSAHFERPDDASRARMALYASHAISTWGQRMWVRTPALLHKGLCEEVLASQPSKATDLTSRTCPGQQH